MEIKLNDSEEEENVLGSASLTFIRTDIFKVMMMGGDLKERMFVGDRESERESERERKERVRERVCDILR